MTISIGVMDQSPVRLPKAHKAALDETLYLAKEAENLGYDRIWFAEHHFNRMYAGSNPEILIAHILAHTSRIRVGAGGIMLRNQTAYKIAEVFDYLGQLYPERVELGLGVSPGTPPDMSALFQTSITMDLEEKLALVKHRLHELAERDGRTPIPIWTLCESGAKSIERAIKYDTGLAVAHYVSGAASESMLGRFVRSSRHSAICAMRVRCADDRIELRRMRMADYAADEVARLGYFPGLHEIAARNFDEDSARKQDVISWEGCPNMLADKVASLSCQLGIQEFLFLVNSYSYESRLKCYELIAKIKKG